MLRRLILAIFLALTALAAMALWGDIPGKIQSVEAVFRPVFHKEIINQNAGIYKEDPLFVTALIKVESNFLKSAKSRRGAVGLMQIMPATGREIARELKIKKFSETDLEDPKVNIRFGFHYLAKLRREFGDNDVLVLSAYNAGTKHVRTWLKQSQKKQLELKDIEFIETRRFVQEVTTTYRWLKILQKWRNKTLRLFQTKTP